jgi:sec-independent protein translocase protein TatC
VADILNRISKETRLFEWEEFQADVSAPESSWFSFIVSPAPNLLAKLKAQVDLTNDAQLSRRLNRALLVRLFADEMRELRMNLVPITVWERIDSQPQSLGVTETFMVWLKAGILTGFTFAAPIVFYHLWTFVAAGLYPHEQKYVHIYLPISIGLFVCGVLLAFLFVFDPVLDFLFSFNRQMGIVPQMRISDWLSFVMFLPLGFGTAFQLPLVMLFLNRIGLVQVSDYLSKWRIAIMVIFVVSMFLTPQDPLSLLLMAIPLSLLYFVGLAMCIWMPKNKNPFEEPERDYVPV